MKPMTTPQTSQVDEKEVENMIAEFSDYNIGEKSQGLVKALFEDWKVHKKAYDLVQEKLGISDLALEFVQPMIDVLNDELLKLKSENAALSLACEKKDLALWVACVASCSCLTKTPDPQHHAEKCPYRRFKEALSITPESAKELVGEIVKYLNALKHTLRLCFDSYAISKTVLEEKSKEIDTILSNLGQPQSE